MDFSKLPKLSRTDRDPGNPATPDTNAPVPNTPVPNAPVPDSVSAPTGFCDACGSPINAGARFCPGCGKSLSLQGSGGSGVSPEAWLSIAVGIIMLLMFQNFPRYALNPSTRAFDATTPSGQVIPYAKSAFFLPDLGVSVFAMILIVTGLLMIFTRARWATQTALIVTALAAALNLWALISSMPIIGFNVNCALAVAFSVYLMISQVAVLKTS